MTIVDYLTSLFLKSLKKTSNLHENSGTVLNIFCGPVKFYAHWPSGQVVKKVKFEP